MIKKILILFFVITGVYFYSLIEINAVSYNYTPLETVIESANSMSVSKVVDNSNFVDVDGNKAPYNLGVLRDVVVYEEKIFIADSTNNVIFELDENYNYVGTFPKENLTEEEEHQKLNQPSGIYVWDNKLYVADTENERIIIFDIETKEVVNIVADPEDPTFDDTTFKPLKIVVDRTGRMFVIALDIFEGIMDFNSEGTFSRFYGTNVITMNFLEALIYRFSSEEQRAKQSLKLQTSFTNIDIDQYGYVYTVSRPDISNTIKKINFKGNDILNRNGYVNPVGDVVYVNRGDVPQGASNLVDIAVSPTGSKYSVLDERRGRIFTYDEEGNLLYIFGQLGEMSSMFSRPSALAYQGENVVVLDRLKNSIIVFEPTNFGALINEAIEHYLNAEYKEARELWEEVIVLNSNYFLAYNGIGKSQLREGDYISAIDNLKLGNDHYNYSKAYEQYRNERLGVILPYLLVAGFVLVGYLFYKSAKKSIAGGDEEYE